MTLKRISRLGLALAMLTLVPTQQSSAARRRSSPGCRTIRVSAPEAPGNKHRRKRKFSAHKIVDLELEVRFPKKLTGQHELELKIFTPKGNLYQSMSIPFSADEPEAVTGRKRRKATKVGTTLPVAGTSIVANSLYGRWKVEAFLDGAEKRCTRPQKFVIKP